MLYNSLLGYCCVDLLGWVDWLFVDFCYTCVGFEFLLLFWVWVVVCCGVWVVWGVCFTFAVLVCV